MVARIPSSPFRSPIVYRLQILASILLGAAILCSAALINGGPIMYPDTLNYLADGYGLIRLTTPDNTRPVFFGLAIEFLHWERSAWPVIVTQALIVAHLIYLVMRSLIGVVRPVTFLLVIALIDVVTPVSWYIAHLLPDLYSSVLAICVFLLVFGRSQSGSSRLGRFEICNLFLLMSASVCFHLTNVVTGAALCVAAWLVHLIWRFGRPGLPSAAFLLAIAALLTSSFGLYGRLTLTPKSPPHLMARLIADGPGRTYLERACPEQHYFVCADLDRLPRTENGILWSYMAHLSDADGRLFRADASSIVSGTLHAFPAQVASHMLINTVRQFLTVESGTEMDAVSWANFKRPDFLVREVNGTLQQRGLLDPILAPLNLLHGVAILLCGLGSVVLFVRARDVRVQQLIATIALALAVNAFAAGALGGVFGRYQGRIAWLIPAVAIVGGLATRGARSVERGPWSGRGGQERRDVEIRGLPEIVEAEPEMARGEVASGIVDDGARQEQHAPQQHPL